MLIYNHFLNLSRGNTHNFVSPMKNISDPMRERMIAWLQERVGEDRGWQVRAAKLLGISQGYLHAYISGRAGIGKQMMQKLADLGCDAEWLLSGSKGLPPEEDVYFYAPKGVSDETRRKYARLARKIASIPPEEIDKVEEVLKLYFKIAQHSKNP